MAIVSQAIPNMNTPQDDVERIVHIIGYTVADKTKEFYINLEVQYFKNNIDITPTMAREVKPIHIHNNMTVYQRNFEDFSILPNPNYVDAETTPDELQYLEAPGYDYLMNVWDQYPEKFKDLQRGYILENYGDGYFENT